MTEQSEAILMRLEAKLAAIDRRGGRAIVTFLVRDDDALEDLAKAFDKTCLLGVLVDEPPAGG